MNDYRIIIFKSWKPYNTLNREDLENNNDIKYLRHYTELLMRAQSEYWINEIDEENNSKLLRDFISRKLDALENGMIDNRESILTHVLRQMLDNIENIAELRDFAKKFFIVGEKGLKDFLDSENNLDDLKKRALQIYDTLAEQGFNISVASVR